MPSREIPKSFILLQAIFANWGRLFIGTDRYKHLNYLSAMLQRTFVDFRQKAICKFLSLSYLVRAGLLTKLVDVQYEQIMKDSEYRYFRYTSFLCAE